MRDKEKGQKGRIDPDICLWLWMEKSNFDLSQRLEHHILMTLL